MLMFGRIQQLLEGGGELFRAEAELASKRVKSALVTTTALLVSMLVVALGAAVALAGLTIEIAEGWGWPLALGAVGSALAVVGIGLWIAIAAKNAGGRPSHQSPQSDEQAAPKQEAEEAKDKMKDAVTPDSKPKEGESLTDELEHLKHTAVEVAAKNPMIVGSAALLVVSLFGPGRTIKLISRAVAAAGLAATALDAFKDEKPEHDGGASKGQGPEHRARNHAPRPRGFENRRPMSPPRRDLRSN